MYIYICIYIYTYICIYICIWIYTYGQSEPIHHGYIHMKYICAYVHIYLYIYIYIYIYKLMVSRQESVTRGSLTHIYIYEIHKNTYKYIWNTQFWQWSPTLLAPSLFLEDLSHMCIRIQYIEIHIKIHIQHTVLIMITCTFGAKFVTRGSLAYVLTYEIQKNTNKIHMKHARNTKDINT